MMHLIQKDCKHFHECLCHSSATCFIFSANAMLVMVVVSIFDLCRDLSYRVIRRLAAHFAAFLPDFSSLGGYGSVEEKLCIHTTIVSAMPETTSSFFCTTPRGEFVYHIGIYCIEGSAALLFCSWLYFSKIETCLDEKTC